MPTTIINESISSRECTKCLEVKPLDSFYRHRFGKHGVESSCKKCKLAQQKISNMRNLDRARYQREYAQANADKIRRYHRERGLASYGLTYEDYRSMMAAQNFGCAICGNDNGSRDLCVDHSHDTGEVRALLCDGCNVGLGRFRDNPETLRAAAIYLETHANI